MIAQVLFSFLPLYFPNSVIYTAGYWKAVQTCYTVRRQWKSTICRSVLYGCTAVDKVEFSIDSSEPKHWPIIVSSERCTANASSTHEINDRDQNLHVPQKSSQIPARQLSRQVPSKPLTLDLMETLDLFFRRACYHWNASYRKVKRVTIVKKIYFYKFGSVHSWYLIHPKKLWN
jgi:hypothetical protein